MRQKLRFLKHLFSLNNLLCMFIPLCVFLFLIYSFESNSLNTDSLFVLLLLALLAFGTTLAVINLGKRGFNWIQGSAIIGSTAAVFAACGQISKLTHSLELIDAFNRLLIKISISRLDGQWSLFVIVAIMSLLLWSYIYIVSHLWVGVRDLESEVFREALNNRIDELSKTLEWSIIVGNTLN